MYGVSEYIFSCCVLLGIIVLYFILLWYTTLYSNPPLSKLNTSEIDRKSIVTLSYLGRRGDMGNQLFQIATAHAATLRSNSELVLPSSTKTLPLMELFDLSSVRIVNVTPTRKYYERDNYESIVIPSDGQVYDIYGYRQAYRYFDDYSAEVRQLLAPKQSILEQVRAALPPKYLVVHIRRGDYIKKMHSISYLREFRRCQLPYYKAGVKKLREVYPDLPVIVCTDSPTQVQSLLFEIDSTAILAPIIPNVKGKFSDFCIMYNATGLVISNSTYSWMAAYLKSDKMVVCPSPWWDPSGIIGTGLGLHGPYLHYPKWWILNCDSGMIEREPHGPDLPDTNHETLLGYKVLRGLFV
jgi:hypothetical protein